MRPGEVEFKETSLTVAESMLLQVATSCCQGCHQWYQHWALMMESRHNGVLHSHDFLGLTVPQFMNLVDRCLEGITAGQKVDLATLKIEASWPYDFERHAEPRPLDWEFLRERVRAGRL